MECKHIYYKLEEGELVCAHCGKSSDEIKGGIEDKVAERTEVKRIIPKGVNKVGRPKRR